MSIFNNRSQTCEAVSSNIPTAFQVRKLKRHKVALVFAGPPASLSSRLLSDESHNLRVCKLFTRSFRLGVVLCHYSGIRY